MSKRKGIIVISITGVVLVIAIIAILVLRDKQSNYTDYISETEANDIVSVRPTPSTEESKIFRYKSTEDSIEFILEQEGVDDYEIFYTIKDTEMWMYYILCNGSVWYVIEDADTPYCEKELELSYEEVLEELNTESE